MSTTLPSNVIRRPDYSMSAKRKVLLMGRSNAGKTSMRSIIFANYIARDADRLGPTMDIEHAHVRFLGNMVFAIWDCGGQETFMQSYLATEAQRDQIFKFAQVMIYVFDVESKEVEKDLRMYQRCLEALVENSNDAKIFCLVHKMDLVLESNRSRVFDDKVAEIREWTNSVGDKKGRDIEVECYRSSIWDETLYKAWSAIVYRLIPNVVTMEKKLKQFADIMDAYEILLFEKSTFLVVAHVTNKKHGDDHRFEKVSNIIKQFKLSCSRMGAQFDCIHIRNSYFSAFIDSFTHNTFIMTICDGSITEASVSMNVKRAKKHFEKLDSK